MAKKGKSEEKTSEETASELYYNVNPKKGDVNITIIANRGSHVRVVSGQPKSDPPKPPQG